MTTNTGAAALSNAAAAAVDANAGAGAGAADSGAAGAGGAASGAANGNWYDGIQNEQTRTWVAAKGFKDPLAAAESAYNLEKLIGHDRAGRTIVLPKDDAPAEEKAAFYQKLGAPTSADGYKLPVPEGEGGEFAKQASSWFHEAGLSQAQAEKIAGQWNGFAANMKKQQDEQRSVQSQQDFDGLKTEWGASYDGQMELARRAVSNFVPAKDPAERQSILTKIEDAIGTGAMMRMFAGIGKGLGEAKMHDGGNVSGLMTPAEAQARINSLKGDKEWTAKYLSGGANEMAEMTKLSKIAAGLAA